METNKNAQSTVEGFNCFVNSVSTVINLFYTSLFTDTSVSMMDSD